MVIQLQRGSCGVSPAALKPALAALSRIIRGKVTLPVLGMVKVEACPSTKTLYLTGTDLDLSMRVEVPGASEMAKDETFLVRLGDLQQLVKTSHPRQEIDLRSLQAGEPIEDFPETPVLEQGTTMQLGEKEIERLLDAFTCCSDDQTRRVICGVYLDPSESGRIVGTDGRHLACFDAPAVAALAESFILPNHKLWSWRGFRQCDVCTLRLGTVGQGENQSRVFQMEGYGWTVTGKGIEGNYPTYRQVCPSDGQFQGRVDFDREGANRLVETLERLAGNKGTPATVGFRVDEKGVAFLHRQLSDQPYIETLFPSARRKGPDITVMMNREYLIKPLRFGFTRMDLIDACSPVKFSGKDGFVIVMPMRCEGPVQTRAAEKQNEKVPENPPVETAQPLTEDQQPKQNMRVNNHNGNGNGHADGNGNGNRLSSTSSYNAEEAITPSDPVDAAIQQLAQTKEALKEALAGLSGLTATLKEVRQQQKDTEREIKTVRSTIRSLRELKL